MNKILPLNIDFYIPNDVEVAINELIEYVNTTKDENLITLDCYECEVYGAVNSALQYNIFTQEQADKLFSYYFHRGWLNADD